MKRLSIRLRLQAEMPSRFVLSIAALAAVLGVASAGCASETEADPSDTRGESQDHLLAGRHVPESEVASMLRQAGFPESMIGKMVCTAKYESSFYERASHRNNNGTTDYGLFQINSVHLGDAGCPGSATGLYDGAANARCAYRIYKMQGITAWYGYRKHRSECDRAGAPSSAPTGGGADTEDPADPYAESGGCFSGTLDEMVEPKTCVQSKYDGDWYQCMDGKWYSGGDAASGPYGACTAAHPL